MSFVQTFSYADIAFFLLLLAILFSLVWIVRLEWKIYRLTAGGKPKNLEEALAHLKEKADDYESFRTDLEKYLTGVEERLRQSVQGMGVVRFNPFRGVGVGGNQSFATAFINENGNGIIISTLYARDHVSVFAKPIHKYLSEFELTNEEKEAIQKAKQELR